MCEIQDYSVELKDIYNNKYSVSDIKIIHKAYNSLRSVKHGTIMGKSNKLTCPALFDVIIINFVVISETNLPQLL